MSQFGGMFLALLTGLGAWRPQQDRAEPAPVYIEVAPAQISFFYGKALAGRYQIDPKQAKPFFWPLNAPNGVPLTRGWPMEKAESGDQTDHVHQKSAWFAFGDVIPQGGEYKKVKGIEGIDFWAEGPDRGRIVCVKVGDVVQDKNHGRVVTHNEWRTADGAKVLDEQRVLHLYNFGDAQLFVLDIDLSASVGPVTFGDTKEGALGVRVRTSLTEDKGRGVLTDAEGRVGEGKLGNVDGKGCWGQTAGWCDDSGPLGENVTGGIALLADPKNPYPTCWHARGYGLLAANPFGREKSGFPAMKGKTDLVKLDKGDHLKLRYGLLLHLGNSEDGKVAEYYDRFTKLPR